MQAKHGMEIGIECAIYRVSGGEIELGNRLREDQPRRLVCFVVFSLGKEDLHDDAAEVSTTPCPPFRSSPKAKWYELHGGRMNYRLRTRW